MVPRLELLRGKLASPRSVRGRPEMLGGPILLTGGTRAAPAPPSRRLYLDAEVGVDEYVRRWENEDREWIRQFTAPKVRRMLWPWLKQRRYATPADDEVLERFLELLGRRGAHLRPGLRLLRTWNPAARRALGESRELAAAVRNAVNAVLTAAGEPELPVAAAR